MKENLVIQQQKKDIPNRNGRYFLDGEWIHNKFRIEKLLGAGSFGQLYKAFDNESKLFVALKASKAQENPKIDKREKTILERLGLRKVTHVPKFLVLGSVVDIGYLVMELLGPNLSELRKRQADKRLSISTVLRVGQQVIVGLKNLHDIEYIHRDVKPSNWCIGIGEAKCKIIYVVDFGLARRFRDSTGRFNKKRDYVGFRGTEHYASINAHNGVEQGPHDDLWSVFYSLIELAEGPLPWNLDVKEDKKSFKFEEFCKYLPKSVKDFQSHLEKIKYGQIPDYSLLTSILQKALPSNVTSDTPYDWEENSSSDVINESANFWEEILSSKK